MDGDAGIKVPYEVRTTNKRKKNLGLFCECFLYMWSQIMVFYSKQCSHILCCTLVPLYGFSSRVIEPLAQLTFTINTDFTLYVLFILNGAFPFLFKGLTFKFIFTVMLSVSALWLNIAQLTIVLTTSGRYPGLDLQPHLKRFKIYTDQTRHYKTNRWRE